jgi:hypothetical protein
VIIPSSGKVPEPRSSEHLDSVDWTYDQPVHCYVTLHRVMLTFAGAAAGLTTDLLLSTVMALVGADARPKPPALL